MKSIKKNQIITEMTSRKITEEDRKIRIDDSNARHLYRYLLKKTNLTEQVNVAKDTLAEICMMLIEKYGVDDNIKPFYPGCKRLCLCTTSFYLNLLTDVQYKLPKINPAEDLINNSELPNVFQICFPRTVIIPTIRKSRYSSLSFKPIYEKLSKEDKELLYSSIDVLVQAKIDEASYLKEYRRPSRSRWRGLREFGKFNTLGQLYDELPEYALIYKYDILNIKDAEEEIKAVNEEEELDNLIMDIRLGLDL